MKKLSLVMLSLAVFGSFNTFANDGGSASITVDQIKMQRLNDNYEVVERLVKPNFVIEFEGESAKKLQKILPSTSLADSDKIPGYKDTFKELVIKSNTSGKYSAKTISISCSDGEIKGNNTLVKSDKSKCTISISPNDGDYGDNFEFEPKTCE